MSFSFPYFPPSCLSPTSLLSYLLPRRRNSREGGIHSYFTESEGKKLEKHTIFFLSQIIIL